MSTQIAKIKEKALAEGEHPTFLFACDPAAMKEAQAGLEGWLTAKAGTERAELLSLAAALRQAKKSKWGTTALRSAVSKQMKRVSFYEKGAEAVRLGYTLIPDFPIDIIAVRVNRKYPSARPRESNYRRPDVRVETSSELPPGEGRYVSPRQTVTNGSRKEQRNGKEETIWYQRAIGLREPEFPIVAAAPAIMSATAEAMAHKLFDEIGVCVDHRTRKGDPMVIGRIVHKMRYADRAFCFLIGWCVRLRDL